MMLSKTLSCYFSSAVVFVWISLARSQCSPSTLMATCQGVQRVTSYLENDIQSSEVVTIPCNSPSGTLRGWSHALGTAVVTDLLDTSPSKYMVNGNTLTIANIDRTDEGVYRCIYDQGNTKEQCIYIYGRAMFTSCPNQFVSCSDNVSLSVVGGGVRFDATVTHTPGGSCGFRQTITNVQLMKINPKFEIDDELLLSCNTDSVTCSNSRVSLSRGNDPGYEFVFTLNNALLGRDDGMYRVDVQVTHPTTSSSRPIMKSFTLEDVDECGRLEESPCPTGSLCLNTLGSYVCSCDAGYHFIIMNGESQGMCIDVDECTSRMPCDVNAMCTNSEGSFSCVCNPGYVGNGKTCNLFNDDSCPQVCDQHCIPSDTARICACDHGYYLDADNHTCRDVNECFEGSTLHNCINARCTNTNGSFECDCLPGYTKQLFGGNMCEDINECTVEARLCDENAMCSNTEGSYTCHCQPPYSNAESSNECILGIVINRNNIIKEKPNHNLIYSIGTNFCLEDPMNSPFEIMFTCPLVNEPQPSPEFHWSIFYNGTELEFDGLASINILNKTNMLNLSGTIELGEDVSLNITCTVENVNDNDTESSVIRRCGPFECQDGVTNNCSEDCIRNQINERVYKYKCGCDLGFRKNDIVGNCEDIDECQNSLHNCSRNARCINTLGEFDCYCKVGYYGNGITCTLSMKVVISVISISIILVFVILANITIAGCIKTYRRFKPSAMIENIQRKIESMSLHKDGRQNKIEMQLTNEYAITNRPQCVVMTDSVRENLPPGLTIKSSHIRIGESIGQGEYGIVYKGCFVKNSPEVVAIKTLKGFFDEKAVEELLTECAKMSTFNNPNVLTVKGVCLDGGPLPYIIMPYMANGSLLSFLKKERSNLVLAKDADSTQLLFTKKRLMDMCLQVAKGMEYLAGQGIIHRDLAARNCMIGMDLVIKVADFGLSVNAGNKDYYRITSDMGIKLPLKWMAPESLSDYIFSEMSDVWAYGVTCWEVFSGGQIPYAVIKPSLILSLLQQGERLEMPNNSACSDDIYSLMLWCWEMEPDKRPSFSTLVRSISISLEAMSDYLRLGPAVAETETTESAV